MKPTYDCYPKYEKCIKKLVWKFVKRSRFDFDELLSEANFAFMRAIDTYNPKKACFHTHLYITVNGDLRNYCNKETQTEIDELNESFSPSKTDNPEQECTFKNLIENLGNEAKEVVNVLLDTPSELIDLVKQMSSNRGVGGGRPAKKIGPKHKGPSTEGHMHVRKSNITQYFRNQGWTYTKIWNSYSEIKQTFGWS